MMYLKLTDRDLVRRYGSSIIRVDKGIGLTLIRHNKAHEVSNMKGEKVIDKTKMLREYMDKMIGFAPIDKSINSEDCIFPELCTS